MKIPNSIVAAVKGRNINRRAPGSVVRVKRGTYSGVGEYPRMELEIIRSPKRSTGIPQIFL